MEYSKFCHKVRNYFLDKRLNFQKSLKTHSNLVNQVHFCILLAIL